MRNSCRAPHNVIPSLPRDFLRGRFLPSVGMTGRAASEWHRGSNLPGVILNEVKDLSGEINTNNKRV